MFERFTERARQVVVLAQDEARALGHGYIGTEHLLLGILREEEGLGGRVLASLGVTVEGARDQVARIVGRGEEPPTGQIPFTPHAKRMLELSLREALSLGHNSIGTEHILLGLVRANDGVGAQVLAQFGLFAEHVRNRVITLLSGPQEARTDFAYAAAWSAPRNEVTGALVPDAPLQAAPARRPEPTPLRGLLIGWALGAGTLAAGLLVGWLIWG